MFFKSLFFSPNDTPEMRACFNKNGYVESLQLGYEDVTEYIIRYCQRQVYGEEIRFPETIFRFKWD